MVLSACETQLGELSAGDEVVGLNRAFLYGTPTVIAILWSVNDEATGVLMENFYTYLQEGMGMAQALQAAQKEKHPYYWAAFIINGDAGEIVIQEVEPTPTKEVRRLPTDQPDSIEDSRECLIFGVVIAFLAFGGTAIGVLIFLKRYKK